MASANNIPDRHSGDADGMSRETSAADAPGPLTHFHPFRKLPPELRYKIWRMAIWTEKTPKIHYYSLYNEEDGGHRESSLPWLIDSFMQPGSKDWVCKPVARHPLRSKPQQCSWTEYNRVLCYWNAGLRTACWESRTILGRYHGRRPRRKDPFAFVNKRPSKRRPSKKKNKNKNKKSSSTTNPRKVVTIRETGKNIYLDFSKRDIVCFRFPPDQMSRCVFLKWEELLTRLPFYHLPQNSDINIAFEFEHSWNEGLGTTARSIRKNLEEASARGLVLRAYWAWRVGILPRWTRLYLIDREEALPPKYQVGRSYDLRYMHSFAYSREFPCQCRESRVFMDGESEYVESYSWDREGQNRLNCHADSVPVAGFIRTVDRFHRPSPDQLCDSRDLPFYGEIFFRVLRPVPRIEDIG
ncbi:unnamed protein product [Clonostachys solani]|uniref:2EXR domain-containing protein n=1 Tax=Clonostachys solani TaxID=160281 RepID=A0A9N9Z913_9HYPO|nr:unnamed protein product [Clonostachys solani]